MKVHQCVKNAHDISNVSRHKYADMSDDDDAPTNCRQTWGPNAELAQRIDVDQFQDDSVNTNKRVQESNERAAAQFDISAVQDLDLHCTADEE